MYIIYYFTRKYKDSFYSGGYSYLSNFIFKSDYLLIWTNAVRIKNIELSYTSRKKTRIQVTRFTLRVYSDSSQSQVFVLESKSSTRVKPARVKPKKKKVPKFLQDKPHSTQVTIRFQVLFKLKLRCSNSNLCICV